MLSFIFTERAHKFAENLGDATAKAQIERYLNQSNFPGPIVTFVGAEGRGKTTLLGKAAPLASISSVSVSSASASSASASSASVLFAGTADWKRSVTELKRIVSELKVRESTFRIAEQGAVGDMLLCDAPSFGAENRNRMVSSLLAITDLVVMAVQITQPAGLGEVAFVREYLTDIPTVLVLTKCDQVDEDDYQDGLEAVLENYGDFPWVAILQSNLDGTVIEPIVVEPMTEHTGTKHTVLPNFEHWWQNEGQRRAEEGRDRHLTRLRQRWQERAKTSLDGEEQKFVPLLEQIRKARSESASIAEARRLQDDIMAGLGNLPDLALSYYKFHLSDLRRDIDQVTHEFTDGIKSGNEVSQTQIEQVLTRTYREWDQATCLHVHGKIKPTLEGLQQKAERYIELITEATHMETNKETSKEKRGEIRYGMHSDQELSDAKLSNAYFSGENDVKLAGDFDLTLPDKLRFATLPTVSGLGTGALLLTVVGATFLAPFAPLIALAGAGAMGIGTFGSQSEGNKQRRASKVREAVLRQMSDRERSLERQFYTRWKRYSDEVRDSVAASKLRLNLLLMQQSPAQDGVLAKEFNALTSNLQKIESLRRDLRWLEEYEQSGRVSAGDNARR